MPSPLELLNARMAELRDLQGAISVLTWDQETMMPARGVEARSEQLATLQGLVHDRLTGKDLAGALAALESDRGLGEVDRDAVRALRSDRDRAAAVPGTLVRELARAQSKAVEAWKEARSKAEFRLFAPHVKGLVGLRRQMADCWLVPLRARAKPGEVLERYDALLEGYEEGMRVARVEPLFARLRGWLAPLVQRIAGAPPPDTSFLAGRFDAEAQWRFTLELLDAMGFDLARGRQDRSAHPFTIGVDPGDVRVTTRIFEDLPLSAVFSTIHEAGHGLYEQGLPEGLRRSVLCAAASMGLHESQSRLWENLVGRSLPFWRAFLPRYAKHLPQLARVPADAFYRAVNKVERTFIRVEADEVTYNLHILLRTELELALVRDELEPEGLPAAWDERMKSYLGLTPKDDAEGVLQDIHWAWGEIGYFPTYTLGNLYAAQLFEAAKQARPDLDAELMRGELAGLKSWLNEHVHRHGRRLAAEEIVRRATGAGLDDGAFHRYLAAKYAPLYPPAGIALA